MFMDQRFGEYNADFVQIICEMGRVGGGGVSAMHKLAKCKLANLLNPTMSVRH